MPALSLFLSFFIFNNLPVFNFVLVLDTCWRCQSRTEDIRTLFAYAFSFVDRKIRGLNPVLSDPVDSSGQQHR